MKMRMRAAAILAACAAVVPFAATADGGKASDASMHDMMMEGMKDMHSMRLSGEQDRDFAMMMSHHHAGGIRMAQAQLQKGTDPKLNGLARKIIDAQKKEKAEFDAWLESHPK